MGSAFVFLVINNPDMSLEARRAVQRNLMGCRFVHGVLPEILGFGFDHRDHVKQQFLFTRTELIAGFGELVFDRKCHP
jgi:hypothetical protein